MLPAKMVAILSLGLQTVFKSHHCLDNGLVPNRHQAIT